jgi:hypothetical protein
MILTKQKVYRYEHTNGKIITKPASVVEMGGGPFVYFDSPFVKRWWEDEVELPAHTNGD